MPPGVSHITKDGIELKYCSYCKDYHILSAFNYSAGTRDNLISKCKKYFKDRHQEKISQITKCPTCNKEMQQRELYQHIKTEHKKPKPYCKDCEQEFSSNRSYQQHIKTDIHKKKILSSNIQQQNMEDKIKEILTQVKPTTSINNKINHPRRKKCKCEFCDKTYDRKSRLKRHVDAIHKKIKYNCDKCESVYNSAESLKQHIKFKHTNNILVKCTNCNKEYNYIYITQHVKTCVRNKILHEYPGKSVWERIVSKILLNNKIDFIMEKKFEDLQDQICLRYDFYFEKINTILEIHGIQHYKDTKRFGPKYFEKLQKHDKMKEEYCKEHDINFIVIDTRIINNEKKITDFLKENLFDLF